MSSWFAASAMMVHESFLIVTLRAMPRLSSSVVAMDMPRSLAMYSALVTMAMSCRMALRRSPKPGDLMAATLSTPRSLLTTSVARASPVMSSVMMSSGWFTCVIFSSSGMRSRTSLTFSSAMSTRQLSNSTSMRSAFVTNCGEMYPRSISMPSSTSMVVSRPWPFSMESTPSAPTFSMASLIMSPTNSLLPAEMDATALMSFVPDTSRARPLSLPTRCAFVFSMPRLMAMGFAPEVTACMP
mmetsp:Transcript_9389/g.32669  ORF Transcript_9389/g.32669 Transcript_9389/m.32669 type:complete len:241 (+) Transcript_9389:922-1644(+)